MSIIYDCLKHWLEMLGNTCTGTENCLTILINLFILLSITWSKLINKYIVNWSKKCININLTGIKLVDLLVILWKIVNVYPTYNRLGKADCYSMAFKLSVNEMLWTHFTYTDSWSIWKQGTYNNRLTVADWNCVFRA